MTRFHSSDALILGMNPVLRFLNSLDARAVRSIMVSLALFLSVLVIFLLGRIGGAEVVFDEDDAPLIEWMKNNANSVWALPVAILIFTIAGFIGIPQFALIAGAVVAFGPMRGAVNAWIATVAAAGVMFWLGRVVGADTLRRYGGDTVNRLSRFIGRNGFWASLTVRFVPLAPAVIVNMAAGVSHMSFLPFVAGTGLGSIPKIALVAFAGQGLMQVLSGRSIGSAIALVAVAVGWLVIMLVVRARLRRQNGVAE